MSTLVNGDNLSKVALAESCAQSPRTSFQLDGREPLGYHELVIAYSYE